jgi:hypothetical protein
MWDGLGIGYTPLALRVYDYLSLPVSAADDGTRAADRGAV